MKKNLLLLSASLFISLLLLEAGIAFAVWLGIVFIKIPSYSLDTVRAMAFWQDIDPDFGVWHPPHLTTRHTRSCFDVTYHSNSYGARDVERIRETDSPRFVVLGDSMTEGLGVEDTQRYTDILERETGIQHLNFGASGHFGTIQYWLLYQSLARKFSHSTVLIGLFPDNDFWDNDYDYGRHTYFRRYRPYLQGEYPDYRLIYYRSAPEESTFRHDSTWPAVRLLSEFTYSYNAIDHVRRRLGGRAVRGPEKGYSGYYDFHKDQLELMKYTLEQIRKLAGDRRIVLALLPTRADFRRYDPAHPVTPLAAELGKFADAQGMLLLDLLPGMYHHSGDWKDLILPCDGTHWNARGHAVAAELLRAGLTNLYRKPPQ